MSVNYMLISIIILAVAIAIPFFTFEKRKPKARHVVMIAVMSALIVVANIICAYTIPLHAGTALVIIYRYEGLQTVSNLPSPALSGYFHKKQIGRAHV